MNMRRRLAFSAVALALVATAASANEASDQKQCRAVTSCLPGGPDNNTPPCIIKEARCAPCMSFTNMGCFEKDLKTGQCPFGADCEAVFTAALEGSSGSAGSGSATTAPPTTTPPATNNSTGSSGSGSKSTSSGDAGDGKEGGIDMALVMGIVGACVVIIAVAVIFFVLVRRSRANDDDDEDMTPTAHVMNKAQRQPSTTTNAVAYAPYAQRPANPTTPTNRVIQYYNDNALPSPHGGRGGGGFGSQQNNSNAAPVKTVRPAVAANAPTFFKPPAAAVPVAQPAKPVYGGQPAYGNVQQQQSYNQQQQSYGNQSYTQQQQAPSYTPAPVYAPAPPPVYAQQPQQPAEPLFTVHAADEQPAAVRRESSPRPRRESYEF